MIRQARWALIGAACLWAPLCFDAGAHNAGTTGYAMVTVSGQSVRYSLSLAADALATHRLDDLAAQIARHVSMTADGRACAAVPEGVTPPTAGRANAVAIVLYACAAPVRALAIRHDLSALLGAGYHTLADIEWPGGREQVLFETARPDTTVNIAGDQAARGGAAVGSFAGYLGLGVAHILRGFDHVLFVLALIMGGGRLFQLLAIVTAFTLAHSVTLALSVLDIVTLPARIVEPVIALSIAYVAAENILAKGAVSRRWAVSFLFGLVHGFGFAGALREVGLPAGGLAGALLGFNLGVEAGQAAIIAAVLPVLLWGRRFAWQLPVVTTVSVAILVAGLVLLVERAFLGEA